MRPLPICFLWCLPAIAQTLQQNPVKAAFDAYNLALSRGDYTEGAAKREEARGKLEQLTYDPAQFVLWSSTIAGLYEADGWTLRARQLLEGALPYADALGEGDETRVSVINSLARLWEDDRNPRKALAYRKEAEAASLLSVDDLLSDDEKHIQAALANPQSTVGQVAGPFRSIVKIYQGQGRASEALAALQRAVLTLDSSGKPDVLRQTISLRLDLANALTRAGQVQAADDFGACEK